MPDYGYPIEFGSFLPPDHGDPAGTLGLARTLDALGYDLIGIQDHPYQANHFDALALIGVILGQTSGSASSRMSRTCPCDCRPCWPSTPPPSISSVGAGSNWGWGPGRFGSRSGAMGGPVRSPGEAVASLEEAIQVIRGMWGDVRSLRLRAKKRGWSVPGRGRSRPTRSGLVGVLGPRMLDLTGGIGDGWIPSMSYVPPAETGPRNALIDAGARAAGRDPAVTGGSLPSAASSRPPPPIRLPRPIANSGLVVHWSEALTGLALDEGISAFILWTPPEERALRLFIEEVAPAVRGSG